MRDTPATTRQSAQVLWSNNTIYPEWGGGANTSGAFFTYPGWWIYSVDIPQLGTASGTPWLSRNADSLRIDPVALAGVDLRVDWVRLVEDNPALYRAVQWTGDEAVDIYLDNDRDAGNGTLGQIARQVRGGAFVFYAGGLAEGLYHVAVRGADGSFRYAPGAWEVQGIPTLEFTSPHPEGSSDDFATTQIGNAWDMNDVTDIDHANSLVRDLGIRTINATDERGAALGPTRVLYGTGLDRDPLLYPLWFARRGAAYQIDADRYRIFTMKAGLAGARDINDGSMVRVVWRRRAARRNPCQRTC